MGFVKRKVEIEIESDVWFQLMKDHKQNEEAVKKQLEEDIDFIYNYTRFIKEQKPQSSLKLITKDDPSDV